jgi:ParB-like nuclease domain
MSVQMIPLDDVLSNPYRQMTRYPFDESKITALLQSIDNSGFWDGSIQGRPSPTEPGKVEIAFGHHRIEAARRRPMDAVGIVVADRSNALMLQMMANENRDEFKHDAWIGVETIASVVDAYGRGEIELEPVHPEAPATQVLPSGKTYNLATVARFLGWIKPSDGQATAACRLAFDAYRQRAVSEEALQRLTPEQRSSVAVKTVTAAVTAARVEATKEGLSPAKVRETEKRAAASAVKEIQDTSGFKAQTQAGEIGRRAVREIAPKAKRTPEIEIYTARLIKRCETAEPYSDILTECYRLVPHLDGLSQSLANQLAAALAAMLKRSTAGVDLLITALRSGNRQRVAALLKKGA